MDSSALRALLFVLFWGGIIGIVREWRYSRRHGLAITGAEKLYLVLTPVLFMAVMPPLLDLAGVPFEINAPASALAMCLTLNAWPVVRRINRT